ncbi:unknown [Firmicutes bacterium CAG:56]|nr:unknown [Firmicutes bacterium CAG:56]
MCHIGRRIGKSDFQFSRHGHFICVFQKIIRHSLCIRQYVKIFSHFYAGKRRTHHISREISATAFCDDTDIHCFFHDVTDTVFVQIMQLHCLAGRKMCFVHMILFYHLCDKFQFFFCQSSARHTQTQHACLAAFLGIASVSSGKSFVFFHAYFFRIKFFCHLPEFGKRCFPFLNQLFHTCSPHIIYSFVLNK